MAEHNETDRLHARHRAYYLQLAEEAATAWMTSDQERMLARLRADEENLRKALEWSRLEQNGELPLLRLTAALQLYWELNGQFSEGRHWLEEALARSADRPSVERAAALVAAGQLATYLGDYGPATELFAESLTLARQLGSPYGVADALTHQGTLAATVGDIARAGQCFTEALPLWRELGDQRRIAECLRNLGYGALLAGDVPSAIALFEQTLPLCREVDAVRDLADGLLSLGFARFLAGEVEAAMAPLREGLTLVAGQGDRPLIARGLDEFAFVAAMGGDAARTARLLGAADGLRQALGIPVTPAYRHLYDQATGAAQASLGDAGYSAAWEAGRALGLDEAIAFALDGDHAD